MRGKIDGCRVSVDNLPTNPSTFRRRNFPRTLSILKVIICRQMYALCNNKFRLILETFLWQWQSWLENQQHKMHLLPSRTLFHPKIRKICQINSYSLMSIRQNYNFHMSATIWHEIISWFLMISQDLRKMINKLFLFWFSYQCRTI